MQLIQQFIAQGVFDVRATNLSAVNLLTSSLIFSQSQALTGGFVWEDPT